MPPNGSATNTTFLAKIKTPSRHGLTKEPPRPPRPVISTPNGCSPGPKWEIEKLGPEGGVGADEGVRADSSAEGLAKLRPAFDPEGSVTAGNASQISDGAAALVVASSDAAEELGVKPLAKIVGHGTAGVSPEAIFTAPAAGVAALLDRHNLTADDIDLFEINEAFAAQVLMNQRALGISDEKLNIREVCLGTPIGSF